MGGWVTGADEGAGQIGSDGFRWKLQSELESAVCGGVVVRWARGRERFESWVFDWCHLIPRAFVIMQNKKHEVGIDISER